MYWKAKGINILPYSDDLLFLVVDCDACRRLSRIVDENVSLAGLASNWEKSDGDPLQERLHLGFVVDLANRLFKIPIQRWEALRSSTKSIFSKADRAQAWKLASLVDTAI